MKVQIDTIPVLEAYETTDECPFCYLQRITEQKAIRYTAGPCASYMEPDVRAATDSQGFCPAHFKKLYDYGNSLGNALMLQTHYETMLLQLRQQMEDYEIPEKPGLFRRKKPAETETYPQRLSRQLRSCAICDQVEDNMQRQYRIFFSLTKEPEFREMVENSKGFCFVHFQTLLEQAPQHLPASQARWFYPTLYRVMEENLVRVKGDLDHLIAKYDHRNSGLPWGNAKDALQRTMQKLSGVSPAEPPYRKD